MHKVNVPVEKAREPDEEARQPNVEDQIVRTNNNGELQIDNRSSYKNLLSQPPENLTHKQKLLWLQQRRTEGLWVQCDDCDSWRYLPRVLERHELPSKWFCWMNPDTTLATCSAPEVPICLHDEEDLIHSEYAAGSVVLARMPGFPWWPAMVDDCPDTEQYYWLDGFSDIPTHYNVVFFDALDATRAWMAPEHLMPYKDSKKMLTKSLKISKYKNRLNEALNQANDAEKLTLAARLAKYSFIARFNGKILSPKKISKAVIKKYQNRMKRKLHIDFSAELTDSEDEVDNRTVSNKTKIKPNRKNTNKNVDAKVHSKSHEPNVILTKLTESTTERSTINLTKELNSLTVQMDTDSGLIHNCSIVLSAASNNSNKEQKNNIFDSPITENLRSIEDSQNSDDFDF
ncbi:uncharacterized protein [Epargyreus clarus]|uniref:uncharacterized protein n=1 Tax=Epargyreus clarus TaxID=520877 RepID=UPI003C2AE69F